MDAMMNSEYYRPEIYFGCDQYNDKVVNTILYDLWDKSYSRTMHRQREFFESMSRTVYLKQFEQDYSLNQQLRIPARAYTLKLYGFTLPIADKKSFIQNYGNYNKAVALKSILKDGKSFSFGIDCSIGKYGFLDMYFYPTLFGYTYLVLLPTVGSGVVDDNEIYENFDGARTPAGRITNTQIRNLMNENAIVTVQWTRHGSVYMSSSRLSTIINTTEKTITINRQDSNTLVKYAQRDTDMNSWDIYATDKSSIGTYLYARGLCSVKSISPTRIVFSLSDKYMSYIMKNTVSSVYLIHKPTRIETIQYIDQVGTTPIFQMKALTNPLNQVNYLVSQYDEINDKRMDSAILDEHPAYFPNVIDLSKTYWAGKNLLIETYELPYSDVTCKFDNPFQDYMNAVGDNYASIVADRETCPKEVANYFTELPPSMDAYPWEESEFKGDIRGYKLNILTDILNDNSYMYKYLQKSLCQINKKYISESGSPKRLKLGDVYVMDNSDVTLVRKDDTTYFEEPHGYISYSSPTESSSLVYMNGALVKSTLQYHHGSKMYVYIPKSTIDSNMAQYATEEEKEMAEPVVIDAFPAYSSASGSGISESMTFYSLDEKKALFENKPDAPSVGLNDLVFVTASGEYISKDRLSFGFTVDEYAIKNENVNEVVQAQKGDAIEYLLTNLEEIYRTKDKIEIVLSVSNVEVPLDDFINELPNGIEDISNKKFPPGSLLIGIKDGSLIGAEIIISTCNGSMNREIDGVSVIENGNMLYVHNYRLSCDERRIEVYMDGLLLDRESYLVTFPAIMGGTLKIDMSAHAVHISPNSVFNIIALPIPMETIKMHLGDENAIAEFFTNIITNEYSPTEKNFTGPLTGTRVLRYGWFDDSSDMVEIPFLDVDTSRIFINGHRYTIHDNDIKLPDAITLTATDDFKLSKLKSPWPLEDGMTFVFRFPCRDLDIYKFRDRTFCMENGWVAFPV